MLGWNPKKTRRIRNLAKVEAYIPKKNRSRNGSKPETEAPENRLKPYWSFKIEGNPRSGYTFENISNPKLNIWFEDFTYILLHGKMYYLAAIVSASTRAVVGWSFSNRHDADLVCDALFDALSKESPPTILHSDRGTEYMSIKHQSMCREYGIKSSASLGGSPWQNGFMESFFSTFKREMRERVKLARGELELYECVAEWIRYYNSERIHTALLMPPKLYAEKLSSNTLKGNR